MTLEFLELLEEMKKTDEKQVQEQNTEAQSSVAPRRKLQKSFKSNTRIYDDGSIEVDPQAQGEPSQKDVKKVGKSKRYVTNGKNPLTCIEMKCSEDVQDKAAFFHKELAKLTKDIQIEEPQMPDGEYLLNDENVKVHLSAKDRKVTVWLKFASEGFMDIRKEFYQLSSKVEKCFAFNEALVVQPK